MTRSGIGGVNVQYSRSCCNGSSSFVSDTLLLFVFLTLQSQRSKGASDRRPRCRPQPGFRRCSPLVPDSDDVVAVRLPKATVGYIGRVEDGDAHVWIPSLADQTYGWRWIEPLHKERLDISLVLDTTSDSDDSIHAASVDDLLPPPAPPPHEPEVASIPTGSKKQRKRTNRKGAHK